MRAVFRHAQYHGTWERSAGVESAILGMVIRLIGMSFPQSRNQFIWELPPLFYLTMT